jgi:hypothetical protein
MVFLLHKLNRKFIDLQKNSNEKHLQKNEVIRQPKGLS